MSKKEQYLVEVENIVDFYKSKSTGSLITLFIIVKKEKNGDLVIKKSIDQIKSVFDSGNNVSKMIKSLQAWCGENNVNLIDARKLKKA